MPSANKKTRVLKRVLIKNFRKMLTEPGNEIGVFITILTYLSTTDVARLISTNKAIKNKVKENVNSFDALFSQIKQLSTQTEVDRSVLVESLGLMYFLKPFQDFSLYLSNVPEGPDLLAIVSAHSLDQAEALMLLYSLCNKLLTLFNTLENKPANWPSHPDLLRDLCIYCAVLFSAKKSTLMAEPVFDMRTKELKLSDQKILLGMGVNQARNTQHFMISYKDKQYMLAIQLNQNTQRRYAQYSGERDDTPVQYKGMHTKFNADGTTKKWQYSGEWIKEKWDGRGSYTEFRGDGTTKKWQYVGDWKKGGKDGIGTQTVFHEDGTTLKLQYTGNWKQGKKDGKGICTKSLTYGATSSQYSGDWKKNCRHGIGTYTELNEDGATRNKQYIGDWINDKMCGRGIYTLFQKDGVSPRSIYEGMLLQNMRHGCGTSIVFNEDGITQTTGMWQNHQYVEPADKKAATRMLP